MTLLIPKLNFILGVAFAAGLAIASPGRTETAPGASGTSAGPNLPLIQHCFLGVDESRGQLIHIDQRNPGQNWVIKLPVKSRDCQLIGQNRILLSGADGYYIYDLGTRAQIKAVHDPRLAGSASAIRLRNGDTLVGCNQKGITICRVAPDDNVSVVANFPQFSNMRLMRLSPQGTLLFGAATKEFPDASLVIEADMSGKALSQTSVSGAKHIYQIVRLSNGNSFISTGYGHFLAEIDPSGKVVKRIEPPASTAETVYRFFSGFQLLKSGNTLVCNWTGHGANDSAKGPQLLEFDSAGKMVWTWHDAAVAGTLHGVILLDESDPVAGELK